VRITTIYEGTSEIMEMTIARDRWQQHLKTRGRYYLDAADELDALHASSPACGADGAALASRSLAEALERARTGRLTRNQHVLLRVGEWVAHAECAGALARRAAAAAAGTLPDKAHDRFDADALAALARVFSRFAARHVADDAMRWVVGAGGAEPGEVGELARALGLDAVHAAQAGLIEDMDRVADALYGRAPG